jgi:predicted DNA-binding transcriptional regulator YafY
MGRKSGTESIAAVLLAFLQHRTWKQAELARHVGVERKTLKRILDDIHNAGLKLEQESDPPHVYWSVSKTWFPGGVAFRADELSELVRTLQLAPQSASRDRILGTIATTATGMRGTSTANAILTRSLSPNEETVLAQLQRAAEERTAVGMKYFTLSRGDLSNRFVSVHRLLIDVGRFIATCHRDNRLKWFRIDGVQSVYTASSESFRTEEDAAVSRLIDESVDGYHSGTPPVRCVFEVHRSEARWVKASLPLPFEAEEHGDFTRFTATTSGLLPLARFVVGLGSSARVQTPELLDIVRRLARGALGEGDNS